MRLGPDQPDRFPNVATKSKCQRIAQVAQGLSCAVRGEDGDWRCLPDVKNLETILDFLREIPHIFPILRWK